VPDRARKHVKETPAFHPLHLFTCIWFPIIQETITPEGCFPRKHKVVQREVACRTYRGNSQDLCLKDLGQPDVFRDADCFGRNHAREGLRGIAATDRRICAVPAKPLTAGQVAWVSAIESSAEEFAAMKHLPHDVITIHYFQIERLEEGLAPVLGPPVEQKVSQWAANHCTVHRQLLYLTWA
jgi:hypothetical protein